MRNGLRTRSIENGRRGATIVFVVLLTATVAMLSLSMIAVVRSSHQENRGSRENLSALYACEAGLAAAVQSLARGGDGNIGVERPVESGSQTYSVTATDIGDGRTSLQATGTDEDARMRVEMIVQRAATGFFRWAAFGDEWMHMDANSRTDSYDSSVGTYDDQMVNGSGSDAYANTDGDIGTNGDVSLDSNNEVWGDVSPGPSGTVTGAGVGTGIHGSTVPLPATIALPEIVLPALPQTAALTVAASTTLPSGQYGYTSLQVNVGKVLTITGPATILCDSFVMKSNSELLVDASAGPVEFFVVGDFILNSNTIVHSSDDAPADVAFNLLSDNVLDPGIDVAFDPDAVDFESGSQMYGTIYAPSASVTIDSNFELFGSLVARRVDLNSNCRIHYDETLATASEDSSSSFQTLCWRVLALQ